MAEFNPSRTPLRDREDAWLSTVELCEAAGVTFRQLDYWVRVGLVPCLWVEGSGYAARVRVFDEATVRMVVEAAKPCETCGCAAPVHKIKRPE